MFAPYPIRYTYGPQYLARIRLGQILASPIHRVCSRRRHITTRIEQNVGSGLGLLPSEYPLDTQTKPKHVKGRAPTVSSLNPQRLLPSDFLDLSGKSWQSIRTASTPPHPLQVAPLRYVSRRSPDIGYLVHDPFPPGTHGFLYYHSPPNLAPTAGEIRFRITHTNDPSSFSSGVDLLLHSGAPWSLPILIVSGNPRYTTFRTQLLNDGVVSPGEMLQCQQISESGSLDRMSTILHSLDQLFPVRFDTTRFTMWAVGHGAVGSCQFTHVFSDWRAEFHGYPVYGGSGLGRFEVIPTPERKIKYRLAIRIIKIVEPIVLRVPTYDGYVHPPTPGELVTRGNNGKRQSIWSVGLNTSSACHKNIHLLLPKLRNLTVST